MFLLAKYNTSTTFVFSMVKRGVVDLAVSADWTPVTGDTKLSKDAATIANTTNNPAIVPGTSALWSLTLTATELSCAEAAVQIVDSATKAVEDQMLRIYTYGNASAKIPVDLSDTVRLGLTALPNAAAAATGGLPTVDATNSVKIQTVHKKNTALTSFEFNMWLAGTNTPATGKTVTVTRSIDGGAYSGGTLTSPVEVANGTYRTDVGAADRNGNVIVLQATAAGCDPTYVQFMMEP